MKELTAAFIIPIVNGDIYLGRRGTDPHKGLYSAIGGKSDRSSAKERVHSYVGTVQGEKIKSLSDHLAIKNNLETPIETAIRECKEELFTEGLPDNKISDEFYLGMVVDTPSQDLIVTCYLHVVSIDSDKFKPAPREITEVTKLTDINNISEINTLTQMGLEQIKFLYERGIAQVYNQLSQYPTLAEQIPTFTNFSRKLTGMIGPTLKMN